jgi:outer membrane protein assembly factor BamB
MRIIIAVMAVLPVLWPAAGTQDRPRGVDWPQWGGPTRDFHAAGVEWTPWPASGPTYLWQRPLGEGYSAIASVGDTLYTMYRRGEEEVVVAIDAATGTTRWEHAYPATWLSGMDAQQGPGPHATPLVHRDRVYAVGATGVLHALDARTGRVVWRLRLIEDLNGTKVMRGYSSSPLAYHDWIIVQIGGDGHAVLALDPADGRVVWRGGSFVNVNSSPIVARVAGEDHIVALGSGEVIGLDARTGAPRWSHPHPHRFRENIPTPIWSNGLLFITSYADGGSRVLELRRRNEQTVVRELWHHTRLRVYYTNVIRIGDYAYGSSGDAGATIYTAVNITSGEVAWQSREIARSSAVATGNRVLLRDDEGHLTLATVTPSGITVLATAPVLSGGPATPPTAVGTRVFARDRRKLIALDLGPRGGR